MTSLRHKTVFVTEVEAPRAIGALLAFASGVVDACTFFALFGLFVAQVTGSFVLAGVQIANPDSVNLVRTLAIPVFFIAGFATALLAATAGESRRALLVTLGAEFVLVAGFATVGIAGSPFSHPNDALALVAGLFGVSAMGVQSALVRTLMKGHPSTNVMTTNTTTAAVEMAQWWLASRQARALPHDGEAARELVEARRRFGMLWPALVGFLAGTAAGAIVFQVAGFWTPLLSLAALAAVIMWAARL